MACAHEFGKVCGDCFTSKDLKQILFLDDDPSRHSYFQKLETYNPHWVVWYAWTSQRACELLDTIEFDIAFLDHDLGEDSKWNGSLLTTEILSNKALTIPKRVIIHSFNPDGAKNMEAKFRSQGVQCDRYMLHTLSEMIREGNLR